MAAAYVAERLEERVLLSRLVYVDDSAPAGGNGSSWALAYRDLQAALTAALSGDEIHVGQGTYKPTSGTDRTVSFVLKNGVGLYGGYAGYGATSPDARNISQYVSTLSGDIGTAGSASDNSYHVVVGSGTDATAVLDGFTISRGNASGSSTNGSGGGVYLSSNASPMIRNCIFTANSASSGGAVFNSSSSPSITACTFATNSASYYGGGINNFSCSPTISNCTFAANSASYGGAGICNGSSTPTIANCAFTANTANGSGAVGGGIYNSSSSPVVVNCIFVTNSATGSGGGVENYSSTPTITNCTFTANSAPVSGGGGMHNLSCSSFAVTNCIFWRDSSPIDNSSSSPSVSYCDVQGGYGGSGNISADPRFVCSPWTGPDGTFGTSDDDYSGLRLRTDSPAMGVGSNAAIPTGVTTDLAGNPRIQSGTVDLGAYEGGVAASARTYYVDANSTGANTGASWADAFTSLQSAVAAAIDGDTIRVAEGTYKPTATTSRIVSFALKSAVSFYGGYAGYGAPDPYARDVALYATVLSGDIGTANSTSDNSYHVLTATGVDSSAILDGFTITAGAANAAKPADRGGGMCLSSASPTIRNCVFAANSASNGDSSGGGGGMWNSFSSPALTDCTFTANSAEWRGGAMFSLSSSPVLTNCTFAGNFVTYSGGNGGAVLNSSSSATITNCNFIANSAPGGGGGMWNYSSSPTIANCTFTANSATNGNNGGGMLNYSSSPVITNCTFTANSASAGGGMENYSSSPTITNCTFTENAGTSSGGGMYNLSSSSLVIANCIFWRNSSQIVNSSSTSSVTYCDVQGGYGGTGNISADPLFLRSPWAGPDGVFGTADDDHGDLRPRVGSPALDAGSSPAIPAGVTTDLAGNSRIQNGAVDLGAYEGGVAASAPRTYYVDVNATGANTGASWADAFTSVQAAVAATVDGDTIRVAHGTYKPTTTDRSISFALKSGVSLYGAYAGYGAPNPSARDLILYPVVLSGDIGVANSASDNSYHVLTATGVGSNTVLDGFTITANADCGMYNFFASPQITNCVFKANSTSGYGGGMFNRLASSPAITNCVFTANSASAGGGVANLSLSSPTITNCVFTANSASLYGGGMWTSDSSPVVANCTFAANSAPSSHGGGMYNQSAAAPVVTNCIFWGNSSAIDNSSSTPTVQYNDVQSGYSGTGNINADPRFVRSPWAGFDGKYGTSDDDYGDLRLQRTSPCIDAGDNTAVPVGVTTDLGRGARFFDVPAVADTGKGTAPIVDMGAYEVRDAAFSTGGASAWYGKLSGDGTNVQVWNNSTGSGSPSWTGAVGSVDSLRFGSGVGGDTLILDASNGNPLPAGGLTLAGCALTAGAMTGGGPVSLTQGSAAAFGGDEVLGGLSVDGTSAATLAAGGHVLVTPSLSLASGGSLMINDGAVVVKGASGDVLAAVTGAIKAGLIAAAADANHGLGILTAQQAVANGNPLAGGFHGQSVSGSDVLVGYGWNGDLNMDGVVNYLDYGVIDNAYLAHSPASYDKGDLNFDGAINYLDYGMMDNAFLAQNAPHGAAMTAGAAAAEVAGPALVTPGLFATAPLAKKVASDLAVVLG